MHLPVQQWISHYGYSGVFLILLLEMIGIPFPAETTLTISGFEWMKGAFSLIPLLCSAALGNIIGSTIAYSIGRYLGRPAITRFGRFIGITESKLNAADEKFSKYRGSLVLFGKFIAGVRVLIPYLAGVNRMPIVLFSVYNTASTLAWVSFFVIVGRYVEVLWSHYHQILGPHLVPALLVMAVGAVIFVGVKRGWNRQRSTP
ncbi:alkaline phosphatase [Alicyclobacillus contaminans]|uniref:DedA family protein n=1 Tax=Alicyclobacillus contaminans TaxID=392016 RepID=UPI00042A3F58|nr:DedA family protein [Alicyclobacillus contaminans]GMA50404.1 alkaline phosphatase [Alicyclobacillus contaminans]